MSCHNWNSEISSVLTTVGQEYAHQNKTYVNIDNARSSLCEIDKQSLKTNMTNINKLRTFFFFFVLFLHKLRTYIKYIKYKDEYLTETYTHKVYDSVSKINYGLI